MENITQENVIDYTQNSIFTDPSYNMSNNINNTPTITSSSSQDSSQDQPTETDRLSFAQLIAIPALERKDHAMQIWLFSGVFWMLVAASIGLIEAIKLFYPEFLQSVPALAYGRLRPVHVNVGLFGFMSMGYLGAAFYMVPRLTQVNL